MTLEMITYRQLGQNGQLGNQLRPIAGTIGIAHHAADTVAFPFWPYRLYFSVPDSLFPGLEPSQGRDLGLDRPQDLRNIEELIRASFTPQSDVWARLAARFAEVLVADLTGDCLFMARNRDYEDQSLMVACDEHIMANSTFSWWRAWLGNGPSVMPHVRGPAFRSTEDLFTTAKPIVLDVPRVAGNAA